jgi:hypothetical protein
MADQTLLMLAREVRGKTLRILDQVADDDARWVPDGLNNCITWHAGHAYTVVEHLSVAPATGQQPDMPRGWFDLFSWKSKPSTSTQFPPLAQVTSQLRTQLEKLIAAIEPLSASQLSHVVDPARNRTLGFNILHGLHDEANHQGEMWLLKKLIGARRR